MVDGFEPPTVAAPEAPAPAAGRGRVRGRDGGRRRAAHGERRRARIRRGPATPGADRGGGRDRGAGPDRDRRSPGRANPARVHAARVGAGRSAGRVGCGASLVLSGGLGRRRPAGGSSLPIEELPTIITATEVRARGEGSVRTDADTTRCRSRVSRSVTPQTTNETVTMKKLGGRLNMGREHEADRHRDEPDDRAEHGDERAGP